ncbi:MAG: hypothetical protein M3017_00870 [Actinomycetota bacterium]|nr:hypothetical protein [Actinomycetota bacterium]
MSKAICTAVHVRTEMLETLRQWTLTATTPVTERRTAEETALESLWQVLTATGHTDTKLPSPTP